VKSGLYVMIITGLLSTGTAAHAFGNEADQLQDLKKDFGPVLKLEGKAKREINATANLLTPDSKLTPIDATSASGEMYMLETVSKHNMVHFSETPEKTTGDIVYYINPAIFIANGLDVTKVSLVHWDK